MSKFPLPVFDEDAVSALQDIGFQIKKCNTDGVVRMSRPGIEVYTQKSNNKYRLQVAWDYVDRYRMAPDAEDLLAVIKVVGQEGDIVGVKVRELCAEIEELFKATGIPYLLNNVHKSKFDFLTRGSSSVLLFGFEGKIDHYGDIEIRMTAWEHESVLIEEMVDVQNTWKDWADEKKAPTQAYANDKGLDIHTLAPIENFITEMLVRGVSNIRMKEFDVYPTTDDADALRLLRQVDIAKDKRRMYIISFKD